MQALGRFQTMNHFSFSIGPDKRQTRSYNIIWTLNRQALACWIWRTNDQVQSTATRPTSNTCPCLQCLIWTGNTVVTGVTGPASHILVEGRSGARAVVPTRSDTPRICPTFSCAPQSIPALAADCDGHRIRPATAASPVWSISLLCSQSFKFSYFSFLN